jgi:hypothetical protein
VTGAERSPLTHRRPARLPHGHPGPRWAITRFQRSRLRERLCCAVFVLLFVGCTGSAGNHEKTGAAVSADPGPSASVILQATHILLLQIESADSGSWAQETARTQARSVKLQISLREVLKGSVGDDTSTNIEISVQQTAGLGSRIFAVPGVWSGKPVSAGTRLVVFCRSSSRNAISILQESHALAVLPPEECLSDVRRALDAEREHVTLPELIPRFAGGPDSPGPLFAEYMAARLDEVLFEDREGFNELLSSLEMPVLPPRFRGLLLRTLFERVLLADPAPPGFAERLVVAALRIAMLPDAAPLRPDLLTNYLPNLLGLEGGATRKVADSVFLGFPGERERAERALTDYPEPAEAALILDWIRR